MMNRSRPSPEEFLKRRDKFKDLVESNFWDLASECAPHTLLTVPKMYNLYKSIEFISISGIPGDIVECGVWHGGAMMLAAKTLSSRNDYSRHIFLYDTFEGFKERSDFDRTDSGKSIGTRVRDNYSDEVKSRLMEVNYPSNNIHFRIGDVLETCNRGGHKRISYLRLDTDTYRTTLHELECLYDSVAYGGIICIDDYGYSIGARKAFHEFFDNRDILFWNRVDGSRVAIKLQPQKHSLPGARAVRQLIERIGRLARQPRQSLF